MNIETLRTEGFVSLPYPRALRISVQEAQVAWQFFCKLPIDVKKVFSYTNSGGGSRIMNEDGSGPMGDIKENFDITLSVRSTLEELLESVQDSSAQRISAAIHTLFFGAG